MNENPKCDNCRYSKNLIGQGDIVLCRRYPPKGPTHKANDNQRQTRYLEWQLTQQGAWCGEHKPSSTTVDTYKVNDLPEGSVVVDKYGEIWAFRSELWTTAGCKEVYTGLDPEWGPFTVLRRGSEESP